MSCRSATHPRRHGGLRSDVTASAQRAMSWMYAAKLASAYPGDPPERAVLFALARHMRAKDTDRCVWPSVERLAELTGYGCTRVREALTNLEQQAWIESDEHGRKGGKGRSTRYWVNVGMLEDF